MSDLTLTAYEAVQRNDMAAALQAGSDWYGLAQAQWLSMQGRGSKDTRAKHHYRSKALKWIQALDHMLYVYGVPLRRFQQAFLEADRAPLRVGPRSLCR